MVRIQPPQPCPFSSQARPYVFGIGRIGKLHAFGNRMTHRECLEGLFVAWRNGDALRSAAYFGVDAVYREAGHEPLSGRDAIVHHFTRFFRDGPLWEFVPEDVIVEGERAAVRYRFAMIAKAGRVEREGCAFVTFGSGTISEWREYGG